MIDFNNSSVFKLKAIDSEKIDLLIEPLLISDEFVIAKYKAFRDFVVFTDKRIISVNTKGITGTKKDYSSLPYSKIQAYSVETVGFAESLIGIGADSELELYFSGLGKVKFEFSSSSDVIDICKVISEYVL